MKMSLMPFYKKLINKLNMNIKDLAKQFLPQKIQDTEASDIKVQWDEIDHLIGAETVLEEVFQYLSPDQVTDLFAHLKDVFDLNEIEDSKVQDRDTLGHRIGRRLGMPQEAITQETFDAFKDALWKNTTTATKAMNASGKRKVIEIQCKFPTSVDYGNDQPAKIINVDSSKDGVVKIQYRPDNGAWQNYTDIVGKEKEDTAGDVTEDVTQ